MNRIPARGERAAEHLSSVPQSLCPPHEVSPSPPEENAGTLFASRFSPACEVSMPPIGSASSLPASVSHPPPSRDPPPLFVLPRDWIQRELRRAAFHDAARHPLPRAAG